ncbi:hypothetical protein FM105_01315 [Brevibacterium yomogidense]|uniref:Uncharacterized protein n=1 Tax=Brevibacterium yomogidense TaxID=946573 RepID=A0A1X6WV23_9MICO|nr:hypothetical protein FM105_01315 [Brevibacterium yomogidense]
MGHAVPPRSSLIRYGSAPILLEPARTTSFHQTTHLVSYAA